jgi:predicted nucleic acid-binding Zn ribbon protein
MRYDYKCNDCSTEEEWVVFEVSHGINEKPKIKCPVCKGQKIERAYLENCQAIYTKGYGWMDKKGRRRDMNLYKLVNDDPYVGMREKGEQEDLAQRLRVGGKHKADKKRGKVVSRKIIRNKSPLDVEEIKPSGPRVKVRRVEYERI